MKTNNLIKKWLVAGISVFALGLGGNSISHAEQTNPSQTNGTSSTTDEIDNDNVQGWLNTNIPDTNFQNIILDAVSDQRKISSISSVDSLKTELSQIKYIGIYNDKKIKSLKGIENLTGLSSLSINNAPNLATVDLSKNEHLISVHTMGSGVSLLKFNHQLKQDPEITTQAESVEYFDDDLQKGLSATMMNDANGGNTATSLDHFDNDKYDISAVKKETGDTVVHLVHQHETGKYEQQRIIKYAGNVPKLPSDYIQTVSYITNKDLATGITTYIPESSFLGIRTPRFNGFSSNIKTIQPLKLSSTTIPPQNIIYTVVYQPR
jgi:hypothetical protein